MADSELKPYHEVALQRIQAIVDRFDRRNTGGNSAVVDANVLQEILETLMEVKMRAEDAHRLAEGLSFLRERVEEVGYSLLVSLSERVIENLRSRQDEPVKTIPVYLGC